MALFSASSSTLFFLLAHLITVNFLLPKQKRRDKYNFIISALTLLTLSIVGGLLDFQIMNKISPEPRTIPIFFHFFRLFISACFIFFLDVSLQLKEQTEELQRSEKLLKEEKLETELQLLKAQINPHFIFNALNNIYSLTYLKSDKAPESILKLSEMLRYVFYDCAKDKVHMSSEVGYIENFAAFQAMKSDLPQNITFTNNCRNVEIAPMLFIPFIENAFKYSRIEENDGAYINISLDEVSNGVDFKIENSVPQNKPQSGSGLGINNVKHRLGIIYKEQYELKITDEDDKFIVDLHISIPRT